MKLRGDNKVKGDGTFHEVKEEHNKVRETIHSLMLNNDKNAIPIIYTLFPNRLCKKKDIHLGLGQRIHYGDLIDSLYVFFRSTLLFLGLTSNC